ncbi:phosphodiester glycosidase family protein [Candidatus Sumerlaeota bacterium]|nr:phosphodiester glycosidase family protein [Candidatus Sumerlaeota bacterium]
MTCFVLFAVFLITAAFAQTWEPVSPGVDYRYFRYENPPNDVFVTRMDRNAPDLIIDASLANGRIAQPGTSINVETIPSQVSRYNGAFGSWGFETGKFRYQVIAAVNGCGFSTANGCPDSAMAMNGAFIKRTFGAKKKESDSAMGFAYKMETSPLSPGIPYMGGNLSLPADPTRNRISFADGSWTSFNKINDQPQPEGIVLYTHHYGAKTPAASGVTEIVVEMRNAAPLCIVPLPNFIIGNIREIRRNSGGQTPIPFDCVVIAASGSRIGDLLGKIQAPGTEVRFSLEARDHTGLDWTTMYCGIGPMWGVILQGGHKRQTQSESFHKAVHPRTAVAFNSKYIYFIVVDGRSSRSKGMTLSVLADFCYQVLEATDAVNNDGGGSSILWVNGKIMNKPSDGAPRGVANGLMMIRLQPKEVSTAFAAGQNIMTHTPGDTLNMRTGPGTQFHSFHALSDQSPVMIMEHRLQGLRCQDTGVNPVYWWKVRSSEGKEGWVNGIYLKAEAIAPGAGTPEPSVIPAAMIPE